MFFADLYMLCGFIFFFLFAAYMFLLPSTPAVTWVGFDPAVREYHESRSRRASFKEQKRAAAAAAASVSAMAESKNSDEKSDGGGDGADDQEEWREREQDSSLRQPLIAQLVVINDQ